MKLPTIIDLFWQSDIKSIRKSAGLFLQIVSFMPSCLLLVMGFDDPNASFKDLIQLFSQGDSETKIFGLALIGVPVFGFFVGQFVKRGSWIAYALASAAAIATFFLVFPFPLFGIFILFQIGRVCLYELRQKN